MNKTNYNKSHEEIDALVKDASDILLTEDMGEGNSQDDEFLEDVFLEAHPDEWEQPRKKTSPGTIIRRIVMLVAFCVFVYSAFMLYTIMHEYKEGEDIYKSISNSVFTPVDNIPGGSSVGEGGAFQYHHDALVAMNPDAVGYLVMPSIGVQLPLVQGTDNDYYLTHTLTGSVNKAGTLFIDYRITGGLSASQVIVYGHNLAAGGMFTGLLRYQNSGFFYEDGNRTFYIYSGNKRYTYEIFSVYVTEPVSDTYQFNFPTKESMQDYARRVKGQSLFSTGTSVDNASQILTFSTCTNDLENRVIVHSVLVGTSDI